MFFFFTCGQHTFSSKLKGYENVVVQCHNCGNMSGRVFRRWQWFTLCFIPIIPFSFKPWHEVGCHICNFYQDIKFRPDVQEQGPEAAENGHAGQHAMDGYGSGAVQQGPPPQTYK